MPSLCVKITLSARKLRRNRRPKPTPNNTAKANAARGADEVTPVSVVAMRSEAREVDSAVILRGETQAARQVDVTAGELERLVAQTRHLSASLAHDLRTPLARLRSRLEVLPDGDARAAALEEAERLSGIFDTIMRVARIEATQGAEGFEDVDLGDLIEDLAETYEAVVEDEGKSLSLDLANTATVRADRQMLVQAVANLIQNALRHGGQQITLSVHGHAICVVDNGPGVDPADFAEIIKPMVRLDTARKSDGTGLGLALVRAVADRHGAALVFTEHQPRGLAVCLKFADL